MRLLVFCDWYIPGFKAGGPIRSVANFCTLLENDIDIYVLTSNRDLGEASPYKGITSDQWVQVNGHKVYYSSGISLKLFDKIIRELKPDRIYLNSMFSLHSSVLPLLLVYLKRIEQPVYLSPRGMLKESALAGGRRKKMLYISLLRFLKLDKRLTFVATDEYEYEDISAVFGKQVRILTSANIPCLPVAEVRLPQKERGELKMVFVGRVHPIKNLDFLLNCLRQINGTIELTIIATLEDKRYWELCKGIIDELPSNVKVNVYFDVPNKEVRDFIDSSHIFVLPTKGENFGHAIFEALAAGRPALISDQTPWRHLEMAKAGWDLPIMSGAEFCDKIELVKSMDMEEMRDWCMGAWGFARRFVEESGLKDIYLKQFS